MATISLFAAPRDGEASFWSAYDIALVGLLGTREHCGNFAIRSPQGRRGPTLVSVILTPLRWAPQQPTKVATVSQFAAPRDGEASLWSACGSSPPGLPGAREGGDSFAVRSP